MALIGGGGAGNVAGGSNPSGTGTSLNYIGDHCYGYSGSVTVDNNVSTMLDFTTGANSYILAKVAFYSDVINNDDYQLIIEVDGQAVMKQKVPQTYQTSASGYFPIELLITPQSRIKVTLQNVTDSTGSDWTVMLSGRVYG